MHYRKITIQFVFSYLVDTLFHGASELIHPSLLYLNIYREGTYMFPLFQLPVKSNIHIKASLRLGATHDRPDWRDHVYCLISSSFYIPEDCSGSKAPFKVDLSTTLG